MVSFHNKYFYGSFVKICYNMFMEQIITAKLKLALTPEQREQLRKTQLAYRDALNFVSEWAFENGKTSKQDKLQKACYADIRAKFGLPAQMACNVPRLVGATYKGLWTRVKQNAAAKAKGYTKKRYKGLDEAPKFVSPVITYNINRDYSFKTGNRVSINTLNGRVVVGYEGYCKHVALIHEGGAIGAAKLWYDKPRKQFYLLVSVAIELPEPQPTDHKQVIGVDVGQRYLAVATNMRQQSKFFSGKEVRHKANHYARLRKRLQQKGTRSALRRLLTIGQRERRLKLDANHVVSKRIIETYPNAMIGIEELSGIRDRTKRKSGKRATVKQRKANAVSSKWSFAELHGHLAYKSALNGSMAVKVDAEYTSKGCPCCGHISDNNRPNKGLLFVCENCKFELHADLVGSRNIALRTLFIRQDWMNTGALSLRPDVSDKEAKAERLKKYSELRWSPDTSSVL